MNWLRLLTGCASLWLAGLGAAQAQTQDASRALHTRQLAANCAACHGTDGRVAPGSPVAGLAGVPAAQMVETLRAFKEGKREATVMHQLAKGLTDPQIQALADYFAAQKP